MLLRQRVGILLTLIISLLLTILPLPGFSIWLRPDWTLLILIYWVMIVSYRVSVGTAFIFGLLLDLLNGSLLGEHALALVITIYLMAKINQRLWLAPLRQQMLIIAFMVFIYKLTLFIIQSLIGDPVQSYLFWLGILIDVILWPWIFILLNQLQKNLRIGVV